jgi:hypothetical protein
MNSDTEHNELYNNGRLFIMLAVFDVKCRKMSLYAECRYAE